jgi:amidase
MNEIDLAFSSAWELAGLIRRRELSPLELTSLYLERISRFDDRLGSFYTVAGEIGLADAKVKTEQLGHTRDTSQLPPFFGVPTAIKDLYWVKEMPCSYGIQALKGNMPTQDEGVTLKMKRAGFVILGKTATSELGSLPYTEPPGFPPTRNPWNLDYTPGGSSGGAAAALAAGLCPIVHGSDGGGSIRGPAVACGLVGIKPSRGRISSAPVGDRLGGMAVHGPIARTVADAAALLDALSGYMTGDPYWLPEPEISFLEATQEQISNLKIGFLTSIAPIGNVALTCKQAVEETAELLEEMGHILEPFNLDVSPLIEPFTKIWQSGVLGSGVPLELVSPINRWLATGAGSAGDYLLAMMKVQLMAREVVSMLDAYDVLLAPVYMHQPIRIGEWQDLSFEETLKNIINWIAPSPIVNVTGLPAIAIPTGFDALGLPVGVQLIGKPAQEGTIISLAARVEEARPWVARRPALFG